MKYNSILLKTAMFALIIFFLSCNDDNDLGVGCNGNGNARIEGYGNFCQQQLIITESTPGVASSYTATFTNDNDFDNEVAVTFQFLNGEWIPFTLSIFSLDHCNSFAAGEVNAFTIERDGLNPKVSFEGSAEYCGELLQVSGFFEK